MSELDQYDYTLPADLIAQHPLANRVDARLLIVDRARGQLDHAHIRDLPEILSPGDCLVLNDTRVLAARLVGRRTQTGGRWTGLFLAADPQGVWHLMGRTRGKLQPGELVTLDDRQGQPGLPLRMLTALEDGSWLARPDSSQDALSLLDRFGRVPLPPYIRDGEMQPADMEQYQTVYAARPGAVAAPTAGLHFTQGLLNTLSTKGVEIGYVTLHVGAGTFRPITTEHLEQHQMHAEWGTIDDECVRRVTECRQRGGRTVAVGSTAVRVLETAAADGTLRPWQGETRLFIRPPYAFQAVDAMLTNFHLPKTTLLVMVRAFGGDALIRRAYEEAIKQQYRFYSYGDAMLIL
jgi:S-adenosylmethionine:tRNA ribosyltransferase-isomerase